MSRSYRKNVYASWHSGNRMKSWRTQENRRLRHNAKQIINCCVDYDVLIIPVLNDYDTLWGSPNDGRKKPWDAPLLNQCEVDLEKAIQRVYRWRTYGRTPEQITEFIEKETKDYVHGGKLCNCYSNKRHSSYWKVKRQ